VVNFWRVVQRPDSRRRLLDLVALTPYSRAVFEECVGALDNGEENAVRRAWSLLVTCNQGRNGHGLREGSWAYEKGVANKKADAWAKLPARLEWAGRRLRQVRIECLPYQETLQRLSSPKAVVLLDPPYWPSTRGAAKVYLHEFSCKEHRSLLHIVGKLKMARVILCGYRNGTYDEMLDGWRRTDFKTKSYAASRARGRTRDERVLSIWTNFVPHA